MTRSRTLRRAATVLLALGVTAAWAAPTQQEAAVQIRLTGAGLRVTPDRITVRPGQEVVWNSELPFAIAVQENEAVFGRELPAAALRARAAAGAQGAANAAEQGLANASVRARIGQEAPPGTYKYSVAVWDGEDVWVLDPEIEIEPPR